MQKGKGPGEGHKRRVKDFVLNWELISNNHPLHYLASYHTLPNFGKIFKHHLYSGVCQNLGEVAYVTDLTNCYAEGDSGKKIRVGDFSGQKLGRVGKPKPQAGIFSLALKHTHVALHCFCLINILNFFLCVHVQKVKKIVKNENRSVQLW